jgi:hypothetical protein
MNNLFYGLNDRPEFIKGVQHAINQISDPGGIYAGDNLFAYHRNLSFLEDEALMASAQKNATDVERGILWRTSILLWAARNGLHLEGDFVECGCYKGTSAKVVADALDFGQVDKQYFLYDLFEHDAGMAHHAMPEHGSALFDAVALRFADMPNVRVVKGKVPDVLQTQAPEKIAFLHLDLNSAGAEIGALDVLFDRMVPGAALVLDDYGWFYYRAQKLAEDAWLATRGYHVAELPTGQGLVIKR